MSGKYKSDTKRQYMEYFTLGFRQSDGSVEKCNIPLSKIKCMLVNERKNESWLHLTTGFAGPFTNMVFVKGSVQRLEEHGVKILLLGGQLLVMH